MALEGRCSIGELTGLPAAVALARGTAIEGKTILLHAEQGFGETHSIRALRADGCRARCKGYRWRCSLN